MINVPTIARYAACVFVSVMIFCAVKYDIPIIAIMASALAICAAIDVAVWYERKKGEKNGTHASIDRRP